ncbi:DoxX family membrane protein [Arthrobacter sp. 35/47]|uniref:DoxX family protein n=1 Tax=Arthrobacter sp. 35/47 TaxID=269454 RepID=UPI00047E633F|nr:DoxX family membrane protein [Arthrobacter sp. 35/47]
MTLVRVLARPLLASSFVLTGIDRLRNTDATAAALRPTLDRITKAVPAAASATGNEQAVAKVLGTAHLGAAVLLGIGRFSRLSALVLVVTSTLNAVVEFNNADSSTSKARKERRNQLIKNLSLLGAVLLAAVDTNGRPSWAWRAEHFAEDARRNALALSHDTRKNIRKAEKAVRKTASEVTGS